MGFSYARIKNIVPTVLGKKRTGKKSIRKRAHAEKSAIGKERTRKKAQIQLFQQIILLITVEFLSHINVNMKMCVI